MTGRIISNPDPALTPGALNPAVTIKTIYETIGVNGWATTQRPTGWRRVNLRRKVLKRYGLSILARGYVVDHLIPIECGGHPTSLANMWPTNDMAANHAKDLIENRARHQILSGERDLNVVRLLFAADWRRAAR